MGNRQTRGSEIYFDQWDEIAKRFESLVVQGEHQIVKDEFQNLNLRQIPRDKALFFAEIGWRISKPLITLKILRPHIVPENTFAPPATDAEKITYASALANVGATKEALELLSSIDPQKSPEVLLRTAITNFKSWDYSQSVPLLQDFISRKEITSYKRLIGKVNLAATYINLYKWGEATNLLSEIQKECEQNSHTLLLGNCFELQAQVELFNQRFESANHFLEKALVTLQNQGGDFHLYAEKWWVINRCFMHREAPEELQSWLLKLEGVRKQSKELLHWETVRECDLFESILTQNVELVRKVTVGTPFVSYRQRVRHFFGENIVARGNFELLLGDEKSTEHTYRFNPYEKQQTQGLYEKSMLLFLFEALIQDFYKPCHIGALFERVYSSEKFNAFTSPDRVLKLMKRLNKWFVDQDVPLRIRLKKSEFSLVALDQKTVRISFVKGKKLTKTDGHFSQLKELFRGRSFSVQQVSTKLNISRATAQRLLLQALNAKQVVKKGHGRATFYQLQFRTPKRMAG